MIPISLSAHPGIFEVVLWLKSLTALNIRENLIILELLSKASGLQSYGAFCDLLSPDAVSIITTCDAPHSSLGTFFCAFVRSPLRGNLQGLSTSFPKLFVACHGGHLGLQWMDIGPGTCLLGVFVPPIRHGHKHVHLSMPTKTCRC